MHQFSFFTHNSIHFMASNDDTEIADDVTILRELQDVRLFQNQVVESDAEQEFRRHVVFFERVPDDETMERASGLACARHRKITRKMHELGSDSPYLKRWIKHERRAAKAAHTPPDWLSWLLVRGRDKKSEIGIAEVYTWHYLIFCCVGALMGDSRSLDRSLRDLGRRAASSDTSFQILYRVLIAMTSEDQKVLVSPCSEFPIDGRSWLTFTEIVVIGIANGQITDLALAAFFTAMPPKAQRQILAQLQGISRSWRGFSEGLVRSTSASLAEDLHVLVDDIRTPRN